MVENDSAIITALRKETEEARVAANVATQNLEVASGVIQDLRLEVSSLKRKVSELQNDRSRNYTFAPSGEQTDIEIDAMMRLQVRTK